MVGKMPYYWLMASVRDRRYEQLTAERVLRWGMHVLIHHEDLRATSADASVALFPIEALAYENGAFKAKFARYDGFHSIVFCTLIDARDMEIGSVGHIRYLLDVDRELISNPGVLICGSGEMCAVM